MEKLVTRTLLNLGERLSGGLSRPGDEARSASRGIIMVGASFVAIVIAALAWWSWRSGRFWEFIGIETAIAAFLYLGMRRSMLRVTWGSIE